MKIIVNPSNNEKYSIFSKQGKNLLKNYVKTFNLIQKGGGKDLSGVCPISLEPLRNGKKVCKTSNGQYYHWDDLQTWFQTSGKRTCPATKDEIVWVREVPQTLVNSRNEVTDSEIENYPLWSLEEEQQEQQEQQNQDQEGLSDLYRSWANAYISNPAYYI